MKIYIEYNITEIRKLRVGFIFLSELFIEDKKEEN
jgi:hypothetical protein